jgi:hypothetical protein
VDGASISAVYQCIVGTARLLRPVKSLSRYAHSPARTSATKGEEPMPFTGQVQNPIGSSIALNEPCGPCQLFLLERRTLKRKLLL